MKGRTLTFLVVALALVAGSGLAVAESGDTEEVLRKNSVSIGAGSLDEGAENATQITLEYVRWMDHDFGVGVDLDFADDDKIVREWAIAVPFHLKFANYFDVYAGPGYEFQDESITGDDDSDFFFRLGLGVEFDIGQGGWFVEPMIEADLFRSDEKYFLGVAVGKAF
ncbi:MAG: hypothetical protein E4H28_07715 [Gemmatimonadales bacterium]|nr:MAG: hypothetical protein E4H28_07715 [Gemmatimonadales bacterium]